MPENSQSSPSPIEQRCREWEKTIDVVMHKENLKQGRVRQWLTTQTIFFAFVGLLLAHSLGSSEESRAWVMIVPIPMLCIFGFFSTSLYRRMDERARQSLRFLADRLARIESDHRAVAALYTKAKTWQAEKLKQRCLELGLSEDSQADFPNGSAHDQEARLLRLLQLSWILLGIGTLAAVWITKDYGFLLSLAIALVSVILVIARRKCTWIKETVHELCEAFSSKTPRLYDERDYVSGSSDVPKPARWFLRMIRVIKMAQTQNQSR